MNITLNESDILDCHITLFKNDETEMDGRPHLIKLEFMNSTGDEFGVERWVKVPDELVHEIYELVKAAPVE